MNKFISFYYGSFLLLAGILLGLINGMAAGGIELFGKLGNIVSIMIFVAIVGIYIDWNEKLKR